MPHAESASPRNPRGQRGAAAVEFALVVPVLLLLLFAIIDYGFMLTLRQSLSQASAEGARAAAVTLKTDARVDQAHAAVQDALSPNGITCTATTQRLMRDGVDVGSCTVSGPTACKTGVVTQQCVTVTLTYDYRDHPIVPTIPGVGPVLPQQLSYAATVRVT